MLTVLFLHGSFILIQVIQLTRWKELTKEDDLKCLAIKEMGPNKTDKEEIDRNRMNWLYFIRLC